MVTLDGNVTIRVGSVDPLSWQLFSDNTVITLSDFDDIEILLKSGNDGTVTKFTLSSDPTQVIIIADAIPLGGEAGEALQFIPESTDFAEPDCIKFYTDLIDGSGGSHPVPEDQEYTITVRDKFVAP